MNAICLYCGNDDAVVTVTLTEDHQFRCNECECEFTVEDVRTRVDSWAKLLAWIEASPFRCQRPAESASKVV